MITVRALRYNPATKKDEMENYSIVFKTESVMRVAKDGFEWVEQTSCAIFGEGLRVAATGYAMASPKDEFDLHFGMERALAKALHKLTGDKAVRAKFWAVFNRAVDADDAQEAAKQFETDYGSSFDPLTDPIQGFTRTVPGTVPSGPGLMTPFSFANVPPAVVHIDARPKLTADQQDRLDFLTDPNSIFHPLGECERCDKMRVELITLQNLAA